MAKKFPLLKSADEARIFSVTRKPDGEFDLREACDGYFSASLTPEALAALGQELIELSKT